MFEPGEISQADDVTVNDHTWLDARTPVEGLRLQVMSNGAGVKPAALEHPKRECL